MSPGERPMWFHSALRRVAWDSYPTGVDLRRCSPSVIRLPDIYVRLPAEGK